MATNVIVPSILGTQAEAALREDVEHLLAMLDRLDQDGWQRPTALGHAPVVRVVEHLAEGAERIGGAWERRLDYERPGPLLYPFDDPDDPPVVDDTAASADEARRRYRDGTARLLHALGTAKQSDWSWPVWSPFDDIETLAEAARRTLAHHFVHRQDVAHATATGPQASDATVGLVVEFVLDALARQGGSVVPKPFHIEVVARPPGPGTWTVHFDQPAPPPEVESVFDELVSGRQGSLPAHRVDRGHSGDARVQVRASGELLWRAAFGRGASWDDLEVHGDDEARDVWNRLVDEVARRVGRSDSLGQVQ